MTTGYMNVDIDYMTLVVVDAVKEAYISVMGKAKWNSLNCQEKHDVVMALVKDANKALENAQVKGCDK